jgi:fructokinase
VGYTVVSFGEVLWDLLPSGPVLGGAPFNFACRVTSLGDRGLMASRLGRDERGHEAFALMGGLGMDTSLIQWDESRPTGTVTVTLDAGGSADYHIIPDVSYDFIELTDALRAAVQSADCVCFGTLAQRRPVSHDTLAGMLGSFRGRLTLLDLNLRPDCWTAGSVRSSVSAAKVLKLNDGEMETVAGIYGLAAGSLREKAAALLGCTALEVVVVTLGEGGAFALSRAGDSVYVPAFSTRLVDTVGSGDAFTAGFIHGLLDGRDLHWCVRHGNALGALVAGQRGATQTLDPRAVQAMLSGGAVRPADPRFASG